MGDLWFEGATLSPAELAAAEHTMALAYELSESEARNRALLSASFEGLCLHEAGHILEVNDALAELYGYERAQMKGMHVSALAAPEILPRIRRIVSSGYTGAYETHALTADGTRVALEARGKAARWNGRAVRVAAFRDLRERKRVEAELVAAREAAEEASLAKTRFLANMSHELRTPMNGVLGMVELLLDGPLPADQRQRAEVIRSSGTHLLGLLNDILDLSQVEEGLLVLRPEPTDLKALVLETFHAVRGLATERGIALELRIPFSLGSTWRIDPLRLRQVLVNLVANAVRHTWSGTVAVSVVPDPLGLRFSVSDTGEGMPPEVLARLFQRFSGHGTHAARGRSGLGLSICNELVRLMGGTIHVASEPGEGSTFSFAVAATQEALACEPPPRVLVLDDQADRRIEVVRTLVDGGVTALGHAGGHGPAALIDSFAPDVLYIASGPFVAGPALTLVGPDVAIPTASEDIQAVHAPVLFDDLLRAHLRRVSATEPSERPVFRRLDVLVVDDHPVNRLVAEQLVLRAGHRVHTVEDGPAAIEACRQQVYDLVLMDVEMPGLTGPEATAMLREEGYTGRIVALTAHALADEARACLDAGMDDILTKPVTVARLLGMLRDAAGTP